MRMIRCGIALCAVVLAILVGSPSARAGSAVTATTVTTYECDADGAPIESTNLGVYG